jgi:hypothetical protein
VFNVFQGVFSGDFLCSARIDIFIGENRLIMARGWKRGRQVCFLCHGGHFGADID